MSVLTVEELVELKVTHAWANLILYCKREIPHGDIHIKIVNGQPTKLLDQKKDIRFDKPNTLPNIELE